VNEPYTGITVAEREKGSGDLLRGIHHDGSLDLSRSAPPDPRRPPPSKRRPVPRSPITPRTP
jgi:hypothetical protein